MEVARDYSIIFSYMNDEISDNDFDLIRKTIEAGNLIDPDINEVINYVEIINSQQPAEFSGI